MTISNHGYLVKDKYLTFFIDLVVLKKTLESVSFESGRGIEEEDTHEGIGVLMNRIRVPQNGDVPVAVQE